MQRANTAAYSYDDAGLGREAGRFPAIQRCEILKDKGKVTAAIAKAFAESEFKKYRVIQDRQYQSDFDRLMMEAESTKQ